MIIPDIWKNNIDVPVTTNQNCPVIVLPYPMAIQTSTVPPMSRRLGAPGRSWPGSAGGRSRCWPRRGCAPGQGGGGGGRDAKGMENLGKP